LPCHIEIKTHTLFPEYRLQENNDQSKWKQRCLREDSLKRLTAALNSGEELQTIKKHFASLPTRGTHYAYSGEMEWVYSKGESTNNPENT
jgi:hypothetical protein